MSFSAMMDEMPTFRSDVEAPTRPVTPTGDHPPKNGKTPSHLYHSESVAAVLQQLSKELIGSSDLSSHSQPPPLLNEDGDDKLASSTAYPQYPREFRAPGAMNDASPARQQQPQSQAQTAPSSHLAVPPHNSPFVAPIAQRLTVPQPAQKPFERHANFYATQDEPMTIDPVMFSPNPIVSPSLPLPAAADQQQPSTFTFIYPNNETTPASSSSATSTPSLAIPSSKILSPTPSTPDLEDAETDDETAYEPPQRTSTLKRATRPPPAAVISRPQTRATPAKPQPKIDPLSPVSTASPPSTSSMPPIPHTHPTIYSVPAAPDAEANSDYQASESGSQSAETQNSYVGGPSRPTGKQTGKTRGVASNHPYKQKQQQSLGTGRQFCTYVSPYDGWRCEQILGRSYDVPRHMEVHAKEEYELVLTGRLLVQHSTLFDTVTEANVYVCLVCRKDFSRKDAMQRHIRNASKMSKAKHRAEMKTSIKKRILGIPINPPPNSVPTEILQHHRQILEKLRVEAQDLGQDVTDWDIENMIPQVNQEDVYTLTANAPGIPVGRRVHNKAKVEDIPMVDSNLGRSTRASQRGTAVTYEEYESDHEDRPRVPSPPATLRSTRAAKPLTDDSPLDEAPKTRSRSAPKASAGKAPKSKADAKPSDPSSVSNKPPGELRVTSETSSEYACEEEKNYGSVEEEDPMEVD